MSSARSGSQTADRENGCEKDKSSDYRYQFLIFKKTVKCVCVNKANLYLAIFPLPAACEEKSSR